MRASRHAVTILTVRSREGPLADLLAENEGAFQCGCEVHRVQMVEPDADAVEARLRAGQVACADCGGELRPWGFARWRTVRDHGRAVRLRPRRSVCRGCAVTHVLLPTVLLLRRVDVATVIGEALHAHFVSGSTQEQVAEAAGAPVDTARRWLRRFAANAVELREGFVALARRLDPELVPIEPRGSPCLDALEAIGVAAAAAVRRLGPAPLWPFVSGASGGRLLSNTSCTVGASP